MMLELLVAAAVFSASHEETCLGRAERSPAMVCVDRNGLCASVTVDGHATKPLTDPATVKRVHAIKHGEDVCWQVTAPVSTKLRVLAKGGGRDPAFVGPIEKLGVNLYALDDYDPEFDSRLDSLNGVELKADGDPNGTWQLHTDKPLKAGEYLAVFRIFGVDNWDRQAVLLKLDPKLVPPAAEKPAGNK